VTVNGKVDNTTWHVAQIAYVNGVIWQENVDKDWWSKTSPAAVWSPPNGTTVNPRASLSGSFITLSSGGSLIDNDGNVWSIDPSVHGGAVSLNGNTDTTTYVVIEVAYVNGKIWQENNGNLWWYKSSPSDSWSPPDGTTVSPL